MAPSTASNMMAGLELGVLTAGIICWLRVWQRRGVARCLPRAKPRAVPWGILEIFLLLAVWQGVDLLMLHAFHRGGRLNAVQIVAATAVSRAILIVVLPVLFWILVGARPYQMGLTLHHWRRGLKIGLAAFVMLTPIVYGIYLVLLQVVSHPQVHEVEKLLERPTAGRVVIAVVPALLLAPLFEELVFRGILLPWMRRRPAAAPAGLVAVCSFCLIQSSAPVTALWRWRTPASLALALGLGLAVLAAHRRAPAWGAILGSAILFALVHIQVWPTPIPLFVLALALGLVYDRTQSLVAPVVLHAAFNAAGTLGLLIRVLGGRPV